MIWETIAGVVAKAVASVLSKTIEGKFNQTDLEKALKAGITAAQRQEDQLLPTQQIFILSGRDALDRFAVQQFLSNFFQQEGIQKELLKPLKNQGLPSVRFLVMEFERAAKKNSKINPLKERMEPWFRAFTSNYFENTPTYSKFQIAKEDYCKKLEQRFDNVAFVGIEVAGQENEKSEKLAQIFVMPDVEKEDFSDKFSAQQLLRRDQSRELVLLGDPGSGKTLLTKYFVMKLVQQQPQELGLAENTEWLPILIQIRNLAKQPEINLLQYLEQFAQNNLLVEDLPKDFFKYWLREGRTLILLDGLDEVADSDKRNEVIENLDTFLKDEQFAKNRVIITSRPAGYKRNVFRTADFPHYNILQFDDPKIDLFIERWHNEQRFTNPRDRERWKKSLKKALESPDQNRIRLLARNPLLLTIIALIHRYEAHRLPQQRHKLYDRAVVTLLYLRESERETYNPDLRYLDEDNLRRLMELLAYWIHSKPIEGDKEGSTLINRDDMVAKLKKDIKTLTQIENYQAEQEALRFLDYISKRTGLLNEQGQGYYAFVHKTFQEYLCAQEINYQADDEDDFEIILSHIRDHLHDPHWQEVLLLLIVQQKPKKAAKAIREILNYHNEDDANYYANLLFAGSCLAENPKIRTANEEDPSSEILRALVKLEVSENSQMSTEIRSQVFQTFCSLNQTDFQESALKMLEEKADCIDRERLKQYRAILGQGNK